MTLHFQPRGAPPEQVNLLVDHLFRHQAGRLVATLTKIFGIENLELAEDVVQETLLKALRHWPFSGVPRQPVGWLLQTAKNAALDTLRRQANFRGKEEQIRLRLEQELREGEDEQHGDTEFESDVLHLMFACCAPGLPRESQVALTLKTLSGFSVPEIARAFLAEEATIAQRLVRAKRKLREEMTTLHLPAGGVMRARCAAVLEVLYLLFNEGYNAHVGEDLVRQDLCFEALRLAELLAAHPLGRAPVVHALLALMWLQASRLPARLDAAGDLLTLPEQDRSRWDQNMIQRGLGHLEKAGQGEELTVYHLEAGIASCHAVAPDYAATDWRLIVSYYDQLVAMSHSPVVALNRAVAVARVEGPESGMRELAKIANLPPLQSYYLLPATLAEFYFQMNDFSKAAQGFQQALKLVGTAPERRFLQHRLRACEANGEE